jgi:hypothetical protein
LKALVLDSVSSPITRRVYNLGLGEFIAWFAQEPLAAGFTKATPSASPPSPTPFWQNSAFSEVIGRRPDHYAEIFSIAKSILEFLPLGCRIVRSYLVACPCPCALQTRLQLLLPVANPGPVMLFRDRMLCL